MLLAEDAAMLSAAAPELLLPSSVLCGGVLLGERADGDDAAPVRRTWCMGAGSHRGMPVPAPSMDLAVAKQHSTHMLKALAEA